MNERMDIRDLMSYLIVIGLALGIGIPSGYLLYVIMFGG